MKVTGPKVRSLRESLGWDRFLFAAVLGIHVSTASRWELDKDELSADPLQRAIIEAMLGIHADERGQMGENVKRSMLANGNLAALYTLLSYLIPDPELARNSETSTR